jgi:hypothetical protein
MKNKEYRRQQEQRIITKRLKLVANIDSQYYEKIKKEPHRLVTQHPYDCGNTKCKLCHSEKYYNKGKKRQEQKQWKEMQVTSSIDGV